jgi:hypothetical protein
LQPLTVHSANCVKTYTVTCRGVLSSSYLLTPSPRKWLFCKHILILLRQQISIAWMAINFYSVHGWDYFEMMTNYKLSSHTHIDHARLTHTNQAFLCWVPLHATHIYVTELCNVFSVPIHRKDIKEGTIEKDEESVETHKCLRIRSISADVWRNKIWVFWRNPILFYSTLNM